MTGLDNSKQGIDQMTKISDREKLNLVALVDDIYQFDQFQDFNIILFDSMFHFEKRDRKREIDLIIKAASKIEKGGVFCFCIQDTGSKVKILKETIQNSNIDFEILKDSSLIYKYEDKASGHKSETKYLMYIIRKV